MKCMSCAARIRRKLLQHEVAICERCLGEMLNKLRLIMGSLPN